MLLMYASIVSFIKLKLEKCIFYALYSFIDKIKEQKKLSFNVLIATSFQLLISGKGCLTKNSY